MSPLSTLAREVAEALNRFAAAYDGNLNIVVQSATAAAPAPAAPAPLAPATPAPLAPVAPAPLAPPTAAAPSAAQAQFEAFKTVAQAISRQFGGPTPSADPVMAVNSRFGVAKSSGLRPDQYADYLNELLYAFQGLDQYKAWAAANPSVASGQPFPMPMIGAWLAENAAVAQPFVALGLAPQA